MKKKIAFITGINGQDGAYLSQLLLNKNYKVKDLVIGLGKLFKKKNFFSILNSKKFKETKHLKLISKKAKSKLKWKKILSMNDVINLIYNWYFKNLNSKKDSYKFTLKQIDDYEKLRLN